MTSPGRKQVWREDAHDVIGLADEHRPGRPLLERVMASGRRLTEPVPLLELRQRCLAAAEEIAPKVQTGFKVRRSARLEALRTRLLQEFRDSVARGDSARQ
jgi:hypothetical protein